MNAANFNLLENYLSQFFDEKLIHGLMPSYNEFLYASKMFSEENSLNVDNLFMREIYKNLTTFEPLEYLLEIDELEELIFQVHNIVKIKTAKISYIKHIKLSERKYIRMCRTLLIKNKISFNHKEPFCSYTTQLNNYLVRLTMLKKKDCPILICRVMNKSSFSLKSFCTDEKHISIVQNIIKGRRNILIAGKTGSGKTSLLQSILINEIESDEQLCVIEDLKEINVISKNIIHLTNSDFNRPIEDLISWSLRLSPDRIILGEIRSREAISFLNILNTGHKGSLSTIHANTAKDAIDRLCFLINFYNKEMNNNHTQIKKLLVSFIDEIIYVDNKKIKEVIKIKGTSKEGALYFENKI
jgi:type IV secretion system protein VirB11